MPKSENNLTLTPYFGDQHFFYSHPTESGNLKVMAINAYDGLKLLFPANESIDDSGRGSFNLKASFTLIGSEWRTNLSKDRSITVSPSVTSTQSIIDVLGNSIHIKVNSTSLRSELTERLGGRDKLYIGVEAGYGLADVEVLAPIFDETDPFFDFESAPKAYSKVKRSYSETSGWLALDKQFGPLLLTPGIRGSYNTQMYKSYMDPRLNLRYDLNQSHAIKAATGQFSQRPQFQDTDKSFGNPDLKFIKSYHYVLGLETKWSDLLSTDFQGFYKETKGLVRSDPTTIKNSEGEQISSGFEAFIRRNLTERWFGWVSYTYSRTRERDNPDETFRNSQYDQTHVANFAGSYKLTGVWELGSRLSYHTGDTITSVDEAVYNANLDKYLPRRDAGARLYNDRLPDYHELDIYAEKDSLFDTWKINYRFGITNLAFKKQAQDVQYNYDYSKKQFFTGIPPIPYFAVKAVL